MKTKIFVAVLLMLALPMTAKDKKEQTKFAQQKQRLTGIWQQCVPMTTNDGGHQIRFVPQFKILSSDGTFCNMSQANSVAPAALFATGEWRITSDSTFVEHLTTNAKSVYEGKDNELTFHLPMGNQVLEVFYTMPGDTRRIREAWIRVQEGDAVAIAQKYFERLNGKMEERNGTPKNENLNSTTPPTKDSVLIVINGEECRDISFDFIANGTHDDYEKFLNSRNLSLERIDIWKNEKKKDQFRRKFGNWVKTVIEITARNMMNYEGNPTENPRGIYKLMAIKGKREVNPYPYDAYKICTDNITIRMQVDEISHRMFKIDRPDLEVFNYTGERTEADATDKSIRVFDSNAEHFTQKWWSRYPNHENFPYNDWCYEYYESGKYSEAGKLISDALTNEPANDPKNPLIGTWQSIGTMDTLIEIDNWKDILTYLRAEMFNGDEDFKKQIGQYHVYTPSHRIVTVLPERTQHAFGFTSRIFYDSKDSVSVEEEGNVKIHWLTDDVFAMKINIDNKDKYQIFERVKDNQTLLNRIISKFLSK